MFLVKDGRAAHAPAGRGHPARRDARTSCWSWPRGLGLPVREEPVAVKDLLAADEVFITSTLKEVLPVATIDGRPVGAGRPGPVTLRLLAALRAYAPGHAR